jgi:segregation and condensation protein B
VRLTRAQVETLSIVAYRQPVTRPEIDDIRGVDSGSSLKILLDRGLLKILGKKEEAGRPLIYGTTPQFLEFFGLGSLRDLPTLREFSELSDESKALFERRSGEPLGDIGVSSAEIDGETGAERQAVDLEASQAVEQVERGDFDEEGAAEADGADADADAEADGADADAGADSNSDADSDADAAESSPQPSPSTGEGAGDADDDDADSEDAKDDDLGDDDDDDDEDDDDEDDDDEDDDDEDDEP